jgi:uncharacterized protein YjeT (DUF2065 family)
MIFSIHTNIFDKDFPPVYTNPLKNNKENCCNMDFFLCVIGMVMIIEGIPYFLFPEKMKIWVQKVLQMPDAVLRATGLSLMIIGLLLIFIVKR